MATDSSAGNAWVDSYLDARKCMLIYLGWDGASPAWMGAAPQPCLLERLRASPAPTRRRRRRAACGGAATCSACSSKPMPLHRPPAVLTYGLSSEYLKSTKEAQAKSKAPDADRSLYRCEARRGEGPGCVAGRWAQPDCAPCYQLQLCHQLQHCIRRPNLAALLPVCVPALSQSVLCAVSAQPG